MQPVFISLSGVSLTHIPFSGKQGCYSAMVLDDGSKFRITELAKRLDVVIPNPNDLHCTIMYSKVAPVDCTASDLCTTSYKTAICTEIKHWTGHDGKTYIVAGLVSEELHHLHARFRKYGAAPTFSPYSPHITLTSFEGELTEGQLAVIAAVNHELAVDPVGIRLDNMFVGDLKG